MICIILQNCTLLAASSILAIMLHNRHRTFSQNKPESTNFQCSETYSAILAEIAIKSYIDQIKYKKHRKMKHTYRPLITYKKSYVNGLLNSFKPHMVRTPQNKT